MPRVSDNLKSEVWLWPPFWETINPVLAFFTVILRMALWMEYVFTGLLILCLFNYCFPKPSLYSLVLSIILQIINTLWLFSQEQVTEHQNLLYDILKGWSGSCKSGSKMWGNKGHWHHWLDFHTAYGFSDVCPNMLIYQPAGLNCTWVCGTPLWHMGQRLNS